MISGTTRITWDFPGVTNLGKKPKKRARIYEKQMRFFTYHQFIIL